MKKYLYLFPTTHDALVAEKNWPQTGLPGKLRPIPRVLSSSCGLCLEVELPESSDPIDMAKQCKLTWEKVVAAKDGNYIPVY
ncbi:MAG: DUF3343 domain-containing protein [Firmicutes bacterium]|nr:DUF3343 domain-containing protein [Bacillota bacterium]